MTPMPDWIEGEQDMPTAAGPDKGRAWWVPSDHGPIVRVACLDGFRAVHVVADFPPAAAWALLDQIATAAAAADEALADWSGLLYRYGDPIDDAQDDDTPYLVCTPCHHQIATGVVNFGPDFLDTRLQLAAGDSVDCACCHRTVRYKGVPITEAEAAR